MYIHEDECIGVKRWKEVGSSSRSSGNDYSYSCSEVGMRSSLPLLSLSLSLSLPLSSIAVVVCCPFRFIFIVIVVVVVVRWSLGGEVVIRW